MEQTLRNLTSGRLTSRHHRTFMRPVDNIARNKRNIYRLARGDRVRRNLDGDWSRRTVDVYAANMRMAESNVVHVTPS